MHVLPRNFIAPRKIDIQCQPKMRWDGIKVFLVGESLSLAHYLCVPENTVLPSSF